MGRGRAPAGRRFRRRRLERSRGEPAGTGAGPQVGSETGLGAEGGSGRAVGGSRPARQG